MNTAQRLDQEIKQPLDGLVERHPLYSQENDFVCKIRFWICRAAEGHLPEQNLMLVDALVDSYERNHKEAPFIGELRGIIDNAYDILIGLRMAS